MFTSSAAYGRTIWRVSISAVTLWAIYRHSLSSRMTTSFCSQNQLFLMEIITRTRFGDTRFNTTARKHLHTYIVILQTASTAVSSLRNVTWVASITTFHEPRKLLADTSRALNEQLCDESFEQTDATTQDTTAAPFTDLYCRKSCKMLTQMAQTSERSRQKRPLLNAAKNALPTEYSHANIHNVNTKLAIKCATKLHCYNFM